MPKSIVCRRGVNGAGQENAVLPERDLQPAATRLGVALLGRHVDEDRRGGAKAFRDCIGHLAGEDAVGLPVGRLEGGQHQRARIGHRRAAHVVGEDGQCECGEQRSGIESFIGLIDISPVRSSRW
jgi:hypothetical protein